VNANCDLKICDLGLARLSDSDDSLMTCYVVTRYGWRICMYLCMRISVHICNSLARLLDSDNSLRACYIFPMHQCKLYVCIHMYAYIHIYGYIYIYVSRWYRAPELLLGNKMYNSSIDMWAVGCVLAELIGRKPLFAGKDYVEMLKLQTELLGNPKASDQKHISEKAVKFLADRYHCHMYACIIYAREFACVLVILASKRYSKKTVELQSGWCDPWYA
jgi:serine/threonine protein kinase